MQHSRWDSRSPAFRSLIGTNNGIGSQGIVIDGTEQQKQYWLPRLARGEIVGSFALTEPDSGSDAASLRTTAVRDGDDYLLNGSKRYITNAPEAGIFTVMARTDPANKGASGVSAFIVEAGTAGLSLGPVDKKMGQRGAHTCDVIFENCRVPAENIIGGREGAGFKTAMKVLDKGRLHIAAVCVGAAERMLNDALNYALERKQFGQRIGDFQLMQGKIADMYTAMNSARAYVYEVARACDRGEVTRADAAACVLYASEQAMVQAHQAVQAMGGAGFMNDSAVSRLFRDAKLMEIGAGTSEIRRMLVGRELMAAMR